MPATHAAFGACGRMDQRVLEVDFLSLLSFGRRASGLVSGVGPWAVVVLVLGAPGPGASAAALLSSLLL